MHLSIMREASDTANSPEPEDTVSYAIRSDVIFDLGMNNGDDTASYIRRGYRVIAVEANPALCDLARDRFHDSIKQGRLNIINAAVSDKVASSVFYISNNHHWSSLEVGWAARDGASVVALDVATLTLTELMRRYSVPLYLKIDVEGADGCVINQILQAEKRPLYVSVEDCRFGYSYIETLGQCGYDGFKLVDQSEVPHWIDESTGCTYPDGSSGPFGEEVPGHWLSISEVTDLYSRTVRDRSGNRLAPRTRWWDIHCTNLTALAQRQ